MTRIYVVAAIIHANDSSKILITKRPRHLHKGGYWEFPGGKIEQGESEKQALARELKEELALTFSNAEIFKRLEYDYPEKKVSLSFWYVSGLTSEPQAIEQQEMAWVDVAELKSYTFPEANEPVVDALIALF